MHIIKWKTGAIIGDGDRKSCDARGPMIWDNFSIFRTNWRPSWRHISALIHSRVLGSRVDVSVTLRDQMLRVARFSSGFFTAMAGDKEPGLLFVWSCFTDCTKRASAGSYSLTTDIEQTIHWIFIQTKLSSIYRHKPLLSLIGPWRNVKRCLQTCHYFFYF